MRDRRGLAGLRRTLARRSLFVAGIDAVFGDPSAHEASGGYFWPADVMGPNCSSSQSSVSRTISSYQPNTERAPG